MAGFSTEEIDVVAEESRRARAEMTDKVAGP
jgi:hypothetical protein